MHSDPSTPVTQPSTTRPPRVTYALPDHLEATDALAYPAPAQDDTLAGPAAVYAERRDRYAALQQETLARSNANATANVVLFIGALGVVIAGIVNGQARLFVLAAVIFAAFLFAFARLGRLNELAQRYAELRHINEEALLRLRRDWTALPLREPSERSAVPPIATDLDLLGRASIQHLLSSATMTATQELLRTWLLEPAAPATIRARQHAARELAPRLQFREELALGGRLMGEAQSSYARFITWAEATPWLLRRPALLWLARVLAVSTLTLLGLQLAGVLAYPFWLAPVAISALLAWGPPGKQLDELLDMVADRQSAFAPYAELYARVTSTHFSSAELRRVQAGLATDDVRGDLQMRRLSRIMQLADLRMSLFFPVLQAFTLWNVHTLALLERWQLQAGRYARGWLEALAEMEALATLATLNFDEPQWAFPEIVESASSERPRSASPTAEADPDALVIVARDLGHPLIPDDARVGNDVTLGPPGTFLLVTGSNMSGKSTLLRAIGVNVVLAQMGAPVCARAMTLPVVRLATSMRMQDSLEEGVSYFMAELRRIQGVIQTVDAAGQPGSIPVLYLLDEILHGTNTSEREIAARRIMRHLLRAKAIGAVSTHDLTLASAPELASAAVQVHFTEQFTHDAAGRPLMDFDYRLRPGLATSSNALKLMELIGLDLRDTNDGDSAGHNSPDMERSRPRAVNDHL